MRAFEFELPDIECPNCYTPIETVLKACRGIKKVTVSGQTAYVEFDDSGVIDDSRIAELMHAVSEIGFPCAGFIETTPQSTETSEELELKRTQFENLRKLRVKKSIRQHFIKGILGVLSGAALIALSISGVGIPLLAMYILGGIGTALTLYLGKDTYQRAVTGLTQTKKLSMESLFAVSTLLAVTVSCVSFVFPWLPMMFDAALLILGFKNLGKAVKDSANEKLTHKSFRSYAPLEIMLEKSPGVLKKIPVKNLWPGNTIIVYSGQTIPVDGVCLSENTAIYNTIVTGRTIPQNITKNQNIYAGSTVPKDIEYIKMKVTEKEANSYLALLDKQLEKARRDKAPLETSTMKILQYFIPAVFGIAIVSAITVGILLSPVAAIQCAISLLVSACPCVLGLITPLAIKTGISKAAEHGVSFKNGKSIEAAAEVDTVVFDLNGTLTTGIPKVTKSTVPKEMLCYLVQTEYKSSHPIAQAICAYAKEQKYKPKEFKSIREDKPYRTGMIADIDDENYIVGNSKIMEDNHINTHQFDLELKIENAEHIVYFAKNKKVVGYILLEDPLRRDAIATVKQLKEQGKHVHICTGADFVTAKKYARRLGIPDKNVKANYLGESKESSDNTKTAYIQKLMSEGHRVCMVGDAGNDATAVANSHFGIAIKSAAGNESTQDKAGAIINKDSLWAITTTFVIAKQTVANIKQNLAASTSYNLLAMIAFSGLLFAIGFAINPAIGAALMILQMGLIFMNVERFRRQSVPDFKIAEIKEDITATSWESIHKKLKYQQKKSEPSLNPQEEFTRSDQQQMSRSTNCLWSSAGDSEPCEPGCNPIHTLRKNA